MAKEQPNYRKPSILQQFSSYSYYHFLVACDSTVTADELSINTEINRFKRFNFSGDTIGNPDQKGGPTKGGHGGYHSDKYAVRTTKGIGEGGSYITLIDGSVDADFIITDVKWATVFSPDTKTMDGETYTNTIELDGIMSIMEPNGVKFLDVISSNVCDGLDTDPTGLIFLLKTIFVGHNEGGGTSTIATVRPLHFNIINIEADFETTGASYSIEFVGRQNGMGKLEPVVAISKQVNVDVSKSATLIDAFAIYAKNLNDQYDKQLDAYAEQLKTTRSELLTHYRPVTYTINVDDAYAGYKIADMENIRTHNKDGDPIITAAAGGGIEEMISRIMGACKQVVLEGKADPDRDPKLKPEQLFGFRILSNLVSGKDYYRMEYTVVRYAAPMSDANALIAGDDYTPSPDQVIEFDYIFTGQNTNILDFKIHMNMGLAYLQTLATTNNVPSQPEAVNVPANDGQANGKHTGATASGGQGNILRKKTPLFLGQQVDSHIARNSKEPIAASSFRDMMNRWAFYENLEASVTIAGNVELMDQTLKGADEQAISRAAFFGDTAINSASQRLQEISVLANVPNFAKINIRMPDSNSLYPTYSDFWYRGFYAIMSVNNIFEDGKFIQQLEMFSVPQIDADKNGIDKPKDVGKSGGTEAVTLTSDQIRANLAAGLTIYGEERTVKSSQESRQAQNKAKNPAPEGSDT